MKFIFLDRDGVINKFPGKSRYVTSQKGFCFIPRSLQAITALRKAGFHIAVISNQGCVSRGLITLQRLDQITSRMLKVIENEDGKIDGVFYCVHQTSDACDCKKPEITLLKAAVGKNKVDLKRSYFIGDSSEDMQAGKRFGCRTVLVLSGRTKRKDLASFKPRPDFIQKNLWEAANWIVQKKF